MRSLTETELRCMFCKSGELTLVHRYHAPPPIEVCFDLVDGKTYQVQVNTGGNVVAPVVSGNTPESTPAAPQISGIDIPAPTPGNIVRLEVAVGESVVKEQTLLVMEAMKMESEVKSPQAGVVQAVHVQAGNTVKTGDALLTLRG